MADQYKYFKIEAEEILEKLTKRLLELEKRPEDQDLIKELLRYVHTMKGAANVVKLSAISELAHKMEDRLALFRDQEKKITSKDVSLLLDAVTVIDNMVEALKAGKPEDSVDISEIIEKLRSDPKSKIQKEASQQSAGSRQRIQPSDATQSEIRNPKSQIGRSETEPIQKQYASKSDQSAIQNGLSGRQASDQQRTLRINVQDMDRLTNLSNELLINHRRLKDIAECLKGVTKRSRKPEIPQLSGKFNEQLESAVYDLEQGLNRNELFSQEMNDVIMNTRFVSVESYTYLFEKAVRDLAVETNKKIDFSVEGGDLLLDRSLLEYIKEPIYHLLRNSVIHGLEPSSERVEKGKGPFGVITLKFEKIGGSARIICQDDGRGLDPVKLKEVALERNLIDRKMAEEISDEDAFCLILKSGFSSAEILTELSGRGVGLDLVKSTLSSTGGSLDIESEKGQFTRFSLTLPLSVNMADTFMVKVSGHNLLIPFRDVLETRLIEEAEISSQAGKKLISFYGSPIPLVSLADLLGLALKSNNHKKTKALIIKGNVETISLGVDDFGGKKSVLFKPLEGPLKKMGCVRSLSILENGDLAFVLSISDLFQRIKELPVKDEDMKPEESPSSILVVDDSLTTRTLIKGVLEGEGYMVQLAQSGEKALEILEKDSFDLAIIDIQMPGIDGFELSKEIRNNTEHKETPIMILSSLGTESNKRRGIEVGANAYIVKGTFDQGIFLETVETLI